MIIELFYKIFIGHTVQALLWSIYRGQGLLPSKCCKKTFVAKAYHFCLTRFYIYNIQGHIYKDENVLAFRDIINPQGIGGVFLAGVLVLNRTFVLSFLS